MSRTKPPHLNATKLDQSPIAITPSGRIVAGLGYVADIDTVDELLRVVRQRRWKGGRLFVGVVLDDRRQAETLRRIDDAASEWAAVAQVFVPPVKKRRGQR